MDINWDVIKGKWADLQGEAGKQWEKLTDKDWEEIAGEWDKLVAKVQQQYNLTREQAEAEIDKFFKKHGG